MSLLCIRTLTNARRRTFVIPLLGALAALGACGPRGDSRIARGAPPPSIDVTGADVTLGFAAGTLRAQTKVASFKLTRHPITVADYRACVSAGSCAAPSGHCAPGGSVLDRATYGGVATDVPITCVTPLDAQRYCTYVGGRLPTASEWLLAARGPLVQRYAWGEDAPDCARYPAAVGILSDARSCCGADAACGLDELTRVGTHPAGASAAGLEDVLVSDAELTASDADAPLASCGGGACIVAGRRGAIEGLIPVRTDGAGAATFRCAFEENGR